MARKVMLVAGIVTALIMMGTTEGLAANSFDQAVDNMTGWLQARLVPVGALAIVVGGFLLMIRAELGRRVLVGALLGTLLVVLARPLITGLIALVGSVGH